MLDRSVSGWRMALLATTVVGLAGCPQSNDPELTEPCPAGSPECPAACEVTRTVGSFELCTQQTDDSYTITARYTGDVPLDLDRSELRVASETTDLRSVYDVETKTLTLTESDLAPGKYSMLFRAWRTDGTPIRPLFVPQWIGSGGFADFTWHDTILYQILNDRFLDGNPANNIDNSVGDLARVDDARSRWQGGDFAGITQKIRDGYFEALGVNALWISSPIINSHNSQPSVGLSDPRRFASYHSYHPIATGYTHLDDLGFATPIEPAFGTAQELHELVREAHTRGIRIIPDFVANHVQREAPMFQEQVGYFFPYNACDNRWDDRAHRLLVHHRHAGLRLRRATRPPCDQVVDHALWMIQEFDLDGFRADALKHMDDVLRARPQARGRRRDRDHRARSRADRRADRSSTWWASRWAAGPATTFGPTWCRARSTRSYYNKTKASLLTFEASVRVSSPTSRSFNDTAYLTAAGQQRRPRRVPGRDHGQLLRQPRSGARAHRGAPPRRWPRAPAPGPDLPVHLAGQHPDALPGRRHRHRGRPRSRQPQDAPLHRPHRRRASVAGPRPQAPAPCAPSTAALRRGTRTHGRRSRTGSGSTR
jgi:hypothetical protein